MKVIDTEETVGEARVKMFMPFCHTLDFLTRALQKDVVIAGGAIRDTFMVGIEMINDYDCWVLDVKADEIPGLDRQLSLRYHDVHAINPDSSECQEYPGRTFHCPKMNMFLPWVPGKKMVQVMYTQRKTLEDLVDNFDWRACAFGFDGTTVVSKGIEDFHNHTLSFNQNVVIQNPKSTLRRGFHLEHKFRSTNYFLRLPNELILALASMLILNGQSENRKPNI